MTNELRSVTLSAINVATSGRRGKVKLVRNRLAGLAKKAIKRKNKKCKLSAADRATGTWFNFLLKMKYYKFQLCLVICQSLTNKRILITDKVIGNMSDIQTGDVEGFGLELLNLLDLRTADECKRINLLLKRKIVKVNKKAQNQTRMN